MIGTTLGHYRVERPLGSGGMGDVYVAEDLTLHRRVALKVLSRRLAEDPDALVRFKREARAAVLAGRTLDRVRIRGIRHL